MNRAWKRTALCASVALLVVLGMASSSQKGDQAEVLLQAATQKELTEGKLEEAIQMYKKILANHGGNRVVAAKALVHMGECYEKLGDAESRKAYERAIREFGDQKEQVAL